MPTAWGPPTFEIDGIKMLPSAHVSPYADAAIKVGLVQPRGKRILDTCGGLGYFAAWCLHGDATQIQSFEKSAEVLWLRSLNPWSPGNGALNDPLTLTHGDISERIVAIPDCSYDAILHDPPRISIAGELYSKVFYTELARVMKSSGKLFHYTGAPHRLSRGRDLAREVIARLSQVGFRAAREGDGVLAVKVRVGRI